jgi:hypothetical protein
MDAVTVCEWKYVYIFITDPNILLMPKKSRRKLSLFYARIIFQLLSELPEGDLLLYPLSHRLYGWVLIFRLDTWWSPSSSTCFSSFKGPLHKDTSAEEQEKQNKYDVYKFMLISYFIHCIQLIQPIGYKTCHN